jgi:hypothetical protein
MKTRSVTTIIGFIIFGFFIVLILPAFLDRFNLPVPMSTLMFIAGTFFGIGLIKTLQTE